MKRIASNIQPSRKAFSLFKPQTPQCLYSGELTGKYFVIRRNPVGRKGFFPEIKGFVTPQPNTGTKIQMTLALASLDRIEAFLSIGLVSAICIYITVKLITTHNITPSPVIFLPHALLIMLIILGRTGYLSEIKTVKRNFKNALEAEEA